MDSAKKGEVLLYKIDGGSVSGANLEAVLKRLKLHVRYIGEDMLNLTLGQCISKEGQASETKVRVQRFDSPVMIINGLSDETLNQLLQDMRRENCTIELKAAVTKHNIEWKLIDLFKEIESEHKIMAEVERLNGLLRQVFAVDLAKVEPPLQMKLIEAAAEGNSLLNGQEQPTCEALQRVCANVEKLLGQLSL